MWQLHDEAPALHSNGEPVPHGADGPLGCRGGCAGLDGRGECQEADLPEGRSPKDAAAAAAGGDFPTPSVSAAQLTFQVCNRTQDFIIQVEFKKS